ncbi:MAG: hypothetical protein GY781_07515 [Gammaproteobacteria bacterium]|nr:hypothetical protein [Gammaproteobacteria bacterium]
MKAQFLYHPENDKYIAEQIISRSGLEQAYSLEGLKIADINSPNDQFQDGYKESGVLILFVGSTFHKIAPYVWMLALQNQCGLFGVNIHTIPDEWGDVRKKSTPPGTEGTCENGETVNLFQIYDIPENEDGIVYVANKLRKWVNQAVEAAANNFGIT